MKIETTKLSIIVPCYNSESYVERCLSSLNRINNQHVEFLLIDDGATDNTSTILERFAKKDSRARVFHKKNGGYCSAINMGIDHSNGDYIMFLGSDDEVDSFGLDKLLCNILDGADIVCYSTLVVFDNGEEVIDSITNFNKCGLVCKDLYSFYEENAVDSQLLFQRDTSRLFKKKTVGNTRYIGRFGVSADGCFSATIALKSNSFQFENIVCYKWHIRKDSVSNRERTIDGLRDELFVWDSFFQNIEKDESILIPGPIIGYIWSYWKAASQLKKKDKESGSKELKCIKRHIKILKSRKRLTKKQVIQLSFPRFYYYYLSLFK